MPLWFPSIYLMIFHSYTRFILFPRKTLNIEEGLGWVVHLNLLPEYTSGLTGSLVDIMDIPCPW